MKNERVQFRQNTSESTESLTDKVSILYYSDNYTTPKSLGSVLIDQWENALKTLKGFFRLSNGDEELFIEVAKDRYTLRWPKIKIRIGDLEDTVEREVAIELQKYYYELMNNYTKKGDE